MATTGTAAARYQRALSPVGLHGLRPDRVQQSAHGADPGQLGTGPAGATPREELAETVTLVSVGLRIRRWSEDQSRLLPTKIIIALALPPERVTPEAGCSIPLATWQVRVVREGPPAKTATQVWTCSSSPTSAAVRQLRS